MSNVQPFIHYNPFLNFEMSMGSFYRWKIILSKCEMQEQSKTLGSNIKP